MSGRPDHAAARWADDGGGEAGGGEILTDVAALTAQRDEYLESLQRLKADFDNYRKRVARLQQEQSARAEANLITKLLPVLDNLDLAWAHLGQPDGGGEAGSEEARALGQARTQMLDLLAKEGLERLDAVNVPFDPTVHDAVAHVEVPSDVDGGAADRSQGESDTGSGGGDGGDGADGPSGRGGGNADTGQGPANGSTPHIVSVDQVLRAGYRWRGQVLRPAMVRVRG